MSARTPLASRDIALNHRLLVVLPHEARELSHAWQFVKGLNFAPADVMLISNSTEPLTAPSAFIPRIIYMRSGEMNLLGLPRESFAKSVWKTSPRFAIDLNTRFYLPGAYLVGASPAQRRIGFHDERAEPFFDCMLKPGASDAQVLSVLKHYLGIIEPTLVGQRREVAGELAGLLG